MLQYLINKMLYSTKAVRLDFCVKWFGQNVSFCASPVSRTKKILKSSHNLSKNGDFKYFHCSSASSMNLNSFNFATFTKKNNFDCFLGFFLALLQRIHSEKLYSFTVNIQIRRDPKNFRKIQNCLKMSYHYKDHNLMFDRIKASRI